MTVSFILHYSSEVLRINSCVPLLVSFPGTLTRTTITTISAGFLAMHFLMVHASLWQTSLMFEHTYSALVAHPVLPAGVSVVSLDALVYARSSALRLLALAPARKLITGISFCPQVLVLFGKSFLASTRTIVVLGASEVVTKKGWALSILSITLVVVLSTYRAPVTTFSAWPPLPHVNEACILGAFSLEVGRLHRSSDASVLWFVVLNVSSFAAATLSKVASRRCSPLVACITSGSFSLADGVWACLSVAVVLQHYRLRQNWSLIATCIALGALCVLPSSPVFTEIPAEGARFGAVFDVIADVELATIFLVAFGGGIAGACALVLCLHLTKGIQASFVQAAVSSLAST
mmetsp:Transcript_39597/g.79965  ORF Transcript_39597/g.79965 Transcript_39597/m.79965 type:complete len:348 (-) Transcript_39597:136-1179(-)|eukprot:CAMPEP_0171705230 /NCGR_PEP_ID=MMETSP0991-20121206/13080_1 /TAXON_ID=483369 /ORGANISM="non described non described, Strain CCMP2098" /LENGTH=347 /DNA_ID=CAMNT_0012294749 /DNA_START=125 /DNA_END=1168 /DNA_ORIENTATION=+